MKESWQPGVTRFSQYVPLWAVRSRFGVRSRGLPCRSRVSRRCWSMKKMITFGRSRVEVVMVSSYLVPVIGKGVCESYLLKRPSG